jgi:hypothetical protein
MSTEPGSQLTRFRTEVRQAERYGRAPVWLIEQAATLVNYLLRADQPEHVITEARALVARVLRLPPDTASGD